MGSDHEPVSPAEQPATDSTEQPAADPAEQPAIDPAKDAATAGAGEQNAGEQPVADAHSEQWRANASRAGEKIKGMFKS
jgi:hypothetical protein